MAYKKRVQQFLFAKLLSSRSAMIAKVKFVVLFTVMTVAVSGLNLKPTSEFYESQKIRGHKLSAKNGMPIGRIHEPVAENFSQRNFRLPNDTEPVSYNVRLSTDIHRGDSGFEGDVTINIRVLTATDSITLHSLQTIIDRIDLFNPDGTLLQANVPYTYDSEVEFLVIPVDGGLVANQELSIEISYSGILRVSPWGGFFMTSYIVPDTNQEVWLATTQLEPTFTRQAFPCYDEIRYRRPFDLRIRHHSTYNALSNMPVAELIQDGEYTITVFEQTLPIAPSVLAFTISNFAFVRNTDPNLVMSVYARPSAIVAGQADNALALGEMMLRRMELILNHNYTLPKSDQLAIPSLIRSGTSNWGLISHSEPIALQLNNNPAAQHLREIRIAHEQSHIFFANLVSPSSWAYLWLNEGYAVLFENILNDIFFPDKNQWESFLVNVYDTAMTVDVMGGVAALNEIAETPQEILNKFDFVTFNKGAIVLRMIGDGITPSTFYRGTSYYLSDRQLDSGSPEDLYAAFQRAYDEDFPGTSYDIPSFMRPWFDNAGFPVLTVSRSEVGLTISQQGFRTLHNELFSIPITFATATEPNFAVATAYTWLTLPEVSIARDNDYKPFDDDDWIIFNVRDTAYYVTNYDDSLWEAIIEALVNRHEDIHFLNRGTLFADFHRFIDQHFPVRIIFFIRMMDALPLEYEPHVWSRAAVGLTLTERRLRGTEFQAEYFSFIQDFMSEIYGQTSFNDSNSVNIINEWSCASGVQECLDDSLNALIEFLETGSTDFEFQFQCNGLRSADEAIYTNFYFRVVDQTTGQRNDDLRDLICTPNEDLLRFYLGQVLNTTNSLTRDEREFILITASVQQYNSYISVLELIEYNSEAISEILPISTLILQLATVTNNFIDSESLRSLLQFVDDDDDVVTEESLVELLQPNQDFLTRNYDDLRSWFNDRNN